MGLFVGGCDLLYEPLRAMKGKIVTTTRKMIIASALISSGSSEPLLDHLSIVVCNKNRC
jgi:hypothetical protein